MVWNHEWYESDVLKVPKDVVHENEFKTGNGLSFKVL